MIFRATVIGGQFAINALFDFERKISRAGETAVRRTTLGGATIVRGKASGRPGPRVITGDYRRSITGDIVEVSGPRIVGQIGTNAAQARRLEYGFKGRDSLNRKYDQPAYPHFTPSVGEIAQLFERETIAQLEIGLAA